MMEPNFAIRENQRVWIPHAEHIWIPGTVVEILEDDLIVEVHLSAKKDKLKVKRNDSYPVNPTSLDDITGLNYQHEPGILSSLSERYKENKIYTFMGTAMIAVNPYQRLPEPDLKNFIGSSASSVAPHPFTISENSYRNLNVLGVSQSIVISGESGAGKTETAKTVINFLAERNRLQQQLEPSGRVNNSSNQMYQRLIQMSPILESFGNAKTLRNANSSRFGKFIKLLYLKAGQQGSSELYGAMVETYLLEKSRVVYQSADEQNFHIFYSLLDSLPQETNLDGRVQFRIARKQSGRERITDPSHQLTAVAEAFTTIGATPSEISGVWKILAALLYLGNISFEQQDSAEGAIAGISNISDPSNQNLSSANCLRIASDLLGVDSNRLKRVLIQREVETKGEKFTVSLTVREANFARDATIKAIYEALFNYIVTLINRSLIASGLPRSSANPVSPSKPVPPPPPPTSRKGPPPPPPPAPPTVPVVTSSSSFPVTKGEEKFIGVLDIFGFESFDRNGFEQLLINYANEALQNTFNKQIFEKELELFEAEKIEVSVGDCPSNVKCVELIAAKGESVFNTLDTISRQPKPTDERFCEELHKAFTKKSQYFGAVHRKDMKNTFVINHYATPVKYSVGTTATASASSSNSSTSNPSEDNDSWIVKNNDAIPDGLEDLYSSSSLSEFKALAANPETASGNKQEPKRRKSVMMKPTIVAVFSRSMTELNDMLEKTNCHFIRCIKPNPLAQPGLFQISYVSEQVRALGILSACEILAVGLPTRVSYDQLQANLSSTVSKLISKYPMLGCEDGRVLLIASIFKAYQIPEEAYRLGISIAFFKTGQLAFVDQILNTSHDAQTEQTVNHTIETAISQFQTINQDIVKISEQIQVAVEYIKELEIRQDRLRNNILVLPDNIGLDLPEDIAKLLGEVEGKYSQQQNRRKEVMRERLKLEAVMASKNLVEERKTVEGEKLWRNCQAMLQELSSLEENDYTIELNGKYDRIHQTIESLEEANKRQVDPSLIRQVEVNDAIFETIMDRVNAVERLISEVKLLAQRCQIDSAYSKYSEINQEILDVNTKTQELSTGIETANHGLQAYEDAMNSINFSALEEQIQEIFRFYEYLSTRVSETLPKSGQLYQLVANYSNNSNSGEETHHENSQSVITTSIMNDAATKPAPTPPEKPKRRDGSIRSSINYGIKDLAAMRKRTSATSTIATTEGDLPTNHTSTTNNSLPPHWKELFDPNTQRCYYVNKITKQRQWQRPSLEDDSHSRDGSISRTSESNNRQSSKTKSVRLTGTGQLPPNWRELIDKKSNRPYYVNTVTKERQWRRPEAMVKTSDVSPDKIESVDRTSRRISRKVSNPSLVSDNHHKGISSNNNNHNNNNTNNNYHSSNLLEERVTNARRVSTLIQSEELTKDEDLSEEMKQTVAYLTRIGQQVKTGFLQKQSKLLQRWRKRFFVLNDEKLFYFDSEKEYLAALKSFQNNPNLSLKAEKQFAITSKTQVSYTTIDNCFSLVNPSSSSHDAISKEKEVEDSWYLLAESEEDQEDWMKALHGHVHLQYLRENKLLGKDFWEEGNVGVSLWKVPSPNAANTARRPVGIRSVPHVNGPRTGEGLFAGDIIEVVQMIDDPDSNQRYLRLADDRGWVFENHPSANYAIMVPVGGKLVEMLHTYEYEKEFLAPLPIFSNPRCSNDFLTNLSFSPGSKFQTVIEWTVTSDQLGEARDLQEDEENISFCLLKLRDGRGWVQMYHPVTGGKQLRLIE